MTSPIHIAGGYPTTRMRRTRQSSWIRSLVRENHLSTDDLIWPCFVCEGTQTKTAIDSMPGVYRYSVDEFVTAVREAADLGIPAVAIFPATPAHLKTQEGEEALNPENLMCRAVRAIKEAEIEIGIICDVALDPYTLHGQDGLLHEGVILNDESVEILAQQSVMQAQAGCDVIAPSDMMDGRIEVIRDALDTSGFEHVQIMSYAAKYASAFYGPFRDAVGSAGSLGQGDKKTYQMDPANSGEAIREVAYDLQEGADMVIIKPGMPYLDIIFNVKQAFAVPVLAYQVSGEYAMLTAAAEKGWLDREKVMMESLLAFKRAGADGILTYFAIEVAQKLKKANE